MSDPQPSNSQPIIKIPLQFHFEPVEILSKQLTKFNSTSPYRIHYLGPRPEDSFAVHKRYANKNSYCFREENISKNMFQTDTLTKNQFYKNQLYYRAFQGTNPTLNSPNSPIFQSRFQSGNLDCVVKVSPEQYDLFLRVDSNTQGHLFWFYFQVKNCKPGTTLKFNICNMSKSVGLYEQGFKPYTSEKIDNCDGIQNGNPSDMSDSDLFQNWNQNMCFDVSISTKKLRYDFIYDKIEVRKLMELTFKYRFTSQMPVRFAYCIPHTYSQMVHNLKKLQQKSLIQFEIKSLGKSLMGVSIPYIKIGHQNDQETKTDKPMVICTGRLHPGETNGSHVLNGLMEYVCTQKQAQYLRENVDIVFIPMLNPDGVILGNSRTSSTGRDLNRQFKSRNKYINPEVCFIKEFCHKMNLKHEIQMFLDFHGHSRKKNMFCFGPNYNITQAQYYRCRILPKIVSQITTTFRYFGCDYTLPTEKSTTARAVMIDDLHIPYVYAVETSIGQFYDYRSQKTEYFDIKKWIELGKDFGRGLKVYFQSAEQFSEYVKSKSNQIDSQKNERLSPTKSLNSQNISKNKIVSLKDIKMLKILEEIKQSDTLKKNIKKNQEHLDNSSDSENEDDNLEDKKRMEFEGLVLQSMRIEKSKQESSIKSQRKISKNLKLLKKKQKATKQSNFMIEMLNKATVKKSIDTQGNFKPRKRVNHSYDYGRKYTQVSSPNGKQISSPYSQIINQNSYFDDYLPEEIADKSKKKMNLRMFNFSKVIESPTKHNTSTSRKGRNGISLTLNEVKDKRFQTQRKFLTHQSKQMLNTILLTDEGEKSKRSGSQEKQTEASAQKMKAAFPSSFYRIKFQNHQKKRKQIIEDKKQQKQSNEECLGMKTCRRKQTLFLHIKKAQNYGFL